MQGQKIWVTGAGGFIGITLVAELRRLGAVVTEFGRPDGELAPLTDDGLSKVLSTQGVPAKVFHLAGGSTVGASIADPLRDFHSNVTTTVVLLDFMRRNMVSVPVVLASSAAVYGAEHSDPLTLDAAIKPMSPYGHHKVIAEQVARSYASQFGHRIVIARLFSIYGRSLRKQLVYDLCGRLAKGERPLALGGTGHELRDWCHIDDAVAALISMPEMQSGAVGTYNLATGQGTDVATVARLILRAWGRADTPVFNGITRTGDPFSLVASRDSLPPNFVPKVTLESGLNDTVAFFKAKWSDCA